MNGFDHEVGQSASFSDTHRWNPCQLSFQITQNQRFLGNSQAIPLFRWSPPTKGTSRVKDLLYPESTDPTRSWRTELFPRVFCAIGVLTDASMTDLEACISRPVTCPTAILRPVSTSSDMMKGFLDIAEVCSYLRKQAHVPGSSQGPDFIRSGGISLRFGPMLQVGGSINHLSWHTLTIMA